MGRLACRNGKVHAEKVIQRSIRTSERRERDEAHEEVHGKQDRKPELTMP